MAWNKVALISLNVYPLKAKCLCPLTARPGWCMDSCHSTFSASLRRLFLQKRRNKSALVSLSSCRHRIFDTIWCCCVLHNYKLLQIQQEKFLERCLSQTKNVFSISKLHGQSTSGQVSCLHKAHCLSKRQTPTCFTAIIRGISKLIKRRIVQFRSIRRLLAVVRRDFERTRWVVLRMFCKQSDFWSNCIDVSGTWGLSYAAYVRVNDKAHLVHLYVLPQKLSITSFKISAISLISFLFSWALTADGSASRKSQKRRQRVGAAELQFLNAFLSLQVYRACLSQNRTSKEGTCLVHEWEFSCFNKALAPEKWPKVFGIPAKLLGTTRKISSDGRHIRVERELSTSSIALTSGCKSVRFCPIILSSSKWARAPTTRKLSFIITCHQASNLFPINRD